MIANYMEYFTQVTRIYAIGGSINDWPFKPVGTIEVLRLNELQNK